VEPLDAPTAYTMTIADLEMTSVSSGISEGGDGQVHMQADEEILKRIFTGDYNPATALIDGNMAVFSAERDKVKLEAIAMVIWGL
jgi:putative sterol carrier protein